MRRLIGPWLVWPAVILLAGSMSAASHWISHDLASRNMMIYSSVSAKPHRFEPPVVGILDLSNDDDVFFDEDPLSPDASQDLLGPTTIIGAWALPWGFYHGSPSTADHFPLGAGPKAPWIQHDLHGFPSGGVSVADASGPVGVDLSTRPLNTAFRSSDVVPPSTGSIHIDHFTVSAVASTPEPTMGLTVVGFAWLAMRRK